MPTNEAVDAALSAFFRHGTKETYSRRETVERWENDPTRDWNDCGHRVHPRGQQAPPRGRDNPPQGGGHANNRNDRSPPAGLDRRVGAGAVAGIAAAARQRAAWLQDQLNHPLEDDAGIADANEIDASLSGSDVSSEYYGGRSDARSFDRGRAKGNEKEKKGRKSGWAKRFFGHVRKHA
ncbi:MAG: hypothetical protein MMC33_002590 [Icmadophila ericetorum]|nr:hypothetical protein [Icmadophila ericetorum]